MFSEASGRDMQSILERYVLDEQNNMVRPSFGRGSIADLPEVFRKMLGMGRTSPLPDHLGESADEVDHLVFFFLDGFGQSTVENALKNHRMSALREFMDQSSYIPVTSVFPSTTSTATVTVQTCRQPVQHGIIGYNAYISEIGAVCNMIRLNPVGNPRTSILDNGWNDENLSLGETIYSSIRKEAMESFLYIPGNIVNSGLTRITGRGAEINGYYSIAQMLTTLRRNIAASRGKTFHLCYISSIDTISHKIGPFTEEAALDIDSIFHLVEKILMEDSGISGTLGVTVSADHGHTVMKPGAVSDAASDHRLVSYMRTPVVGDTRAPIIRIKPGMIHDAYDYIQEKYGDDFMVKYSLDMLKEGYFGSFRGIGDPRDRFGDIILVPKGLKGVTDSRLQILDPHMDSSKLVGVHGGLSNEEMIVPFMSRIRNYH